MSNGSMQFLGRQLAEQAKAMGQLLEKLSELILTTEKGLGVFAIASDDVKVTKIYEEISVSGTTNAIKMVAYVSGVIRLKTYWAGTPNLYTILKNGVSLLTVNGATFNAAGGMYDIAINEGDIIEFYTDNTTPKLTKVEIMFDKIPKPNVAI